MSLNQQSVVSTIQSSMPVTVTTMQPTFLPWLGYFALMQSVDVFVLLDDVQFCNRSFHSRNKIKTAQGPLMLTVPCRSGRRPIRDVEIANPAIYGKLMRSISQSYAKAPFRNEVVQLLDMVFSENHRMLSDLNCTLIYKIVELLQLDTPLLKSSELNIPKIEKHLRLLRFCEKLNATEYLSVPGSMSYLKENNPFPSSNISLKFFSFEHPVYPQMHGAFEPHMSIIDAIANIGPERTNRLLQTSVGPKLEFNQAAAQERKVGLTVIGSGPYLVMPKLEITEGDYKVRAVEPEHIDEIRNWRNSQIDVLRQSRHISPSEQQTYFTEKIWPDKASKLPENILLILLESDIPIGYGGLVNIAWDYRRAEISFLLDPSITRTRSEITKLFSFWLRLMKRLAFKDLGLARLTTETYANRNLHIQILEQHQFRREGRLRRHVYIKGRPVDSLVHGCFAESANYDAVDSNNNVELKNILITSASNKIPLIYAMQNAAQRINALSQVIAGDSDPLAPARHIADNFWQMPEISKLSIATIIRSCKERDINRILPTRDGELIFWAQAQPELVAEGIEVIVSAPEAVRLCLDKLAFSEFGEKMGFPSIPSSTSPKSFGDAALVVKERFGTGSKMVGLNLSYKAALNHAQGLKAPIFQPMEQGPEISVDAYATRAGNVHGLVLRRRDRIVSGESQITTTFRQKSTERILANTISSLGLSGPVVMQAIINESGLKIIEVNPRFGGASTISLAVGLDMLYWTLLECENSNCDLPDFTSQADNICQIRIPQDIVVYDPNF